MLVESGLTRATMADGREFTFRPSFSRLARIGTPAGIVKAYVDLYGPNAVEEAIHILACLCDEDDVTPLVGWLDGDGQRHEVAMPTVHQVILARHLMRHGIVGKAQPEKQTDGQYSAVFNAHEYVASARVHLGLSGAEAEELSMTEFQTLFEMKYPQKGKQARNLPSREDYASFMAKFKTSPPKAP